MAQAAVTRLTAVGAVAALLLLFASAPPARQVESSIAAFVAPASRAVHDAVRPAVDVILNTGQLQTLAEENAELRRTIASLESDLAALREATIAQEQVASLRSAVGGDGAGYVSAAVLLADPSPTHRSLLLDRGAADGIAPGQPVLGPGATLIGVVVSADRDRARVRVLDDPRSAAAVVVQGSRTQGALAGGRDGLRLEFIPSETTIAEGDAVLTSALGGLLPAGLLIGRVRSVEADERALFASISVEPFVDYTALEQVLVMTGFTPAVAESGTSRAGGP